MKHPMLPGLPAEHGPGKTNRWQRLCALLAVSGACLMQVSANAQISLLKDYQNNTSAPIGTYQGINFREAGFSALYPIPNTNGMEFWTVSDRGPNVDCANANLPACRPTYDKMFPFPTFAPKIHRIRVKGDSIQILQTITMKRPSGANATGLMNPTGFGSTATEVVSTDTVMDCNNFNAKTVAKDVWGIDSEGILVDKDGNFWICEEGGPTIWKLSPNGVVLLRFTPYANLAGAQPQDRLIDTCFKYRKNNRGFESIAITPNGKIYAFIQSPMLFPDATTGNASKVHRIVEIDPRTNATRMLVYMNDGIIGAAGVNQIRMQDWKLGDAAAINDSTFLVLEAALRGTSDYKRVYLININQATAVTSGLYNGKTVEGLVDEAGLAANGIVPVTKTLFMDLLANGYPAVLDKAEGLAIINDSTIAVVNDNDFGQSSPTANGIPTATGNLSHLFVYGLKGANKIPGFRSPVLDSGVTSITSSKSPYLQPVAPGVKFTAIITAADSVAGYKMAGTPDGLGAFDNGNGTFTVLMNHEFGNTAGAVRAHGSRGAFVSKWIVNKNNLSIISGADLIQGVRLWNTGTSSYTAGTTAFNRFCSADLPAVSAFYNAATGLGTQNRIFMNGEESGSEGRGFAHLVTGPEAGVSYELPYLGKFSWENSVANPATGNKTVVAGMDDATTGGQVYIYIGTKTNTGNDIEKAGLSGGKLYGVKVTGMPTESSASTPAIGTRFTLFDHGQVQNTAGSALDAASIAAGVTGFLRPEDGAWDPSNPRDFYFATTNSFSSPSRLWRLRFDDLNNPELGGTVEAVLDGTEGQRMLDNITIDNYGHVLMVEDVGGNAHNGKVWQYTIATDEFKLIAKHDPARFGDIGMAAAAPYNQDEEASGVLDVQSVLGAGMFLVVDQAHYTSGIPADIVEGGQFMAFFNPDTKNSYDSLGAQSITSSKSPYLQPVAPGVNVTAIITAGDSTAAGYKMAGTPDGLGAFDNGNGTFTVLMNHEFGNTAGAVRAHGSKGAFVSKWVIKKSDLSVISGTDLTQSVRLWNTGTSSYTTGTTAFNRFCSADLPAVSAFYNAVTGLGTQNRIFMNGEESGAEGRAFGHIVTGTEAGVSYELPYLGKFSWENSVASPVASNKTIVAGMDDATTGGQVYFYIGTKTNTGNDIEKAGLSGGKLYGVKVTGMPTESSASTPAIGTRFTLFDHGQVQNTTGTALDAASIAAGVTGFLRPEDGAWDPSNPRDFYFATTNSFSSPSRLWRLRFDDIANPELGGTVEAVLNGTEGQRMLDNITIDNYGHVLMVEDVGGNAHNGKVWQYTIATDELKLIAKHDVARFGDIGIAATAPYNQDEEASGILDVQAVLGAGMFLVVDQAHYNSGIPADIVEGGQFMAFFNPDTKMAFDTLGAQGITSSKSPYLQPVAPGVTFTSVITAADSTAGGYKMAGTPDGLGAFDNGNGTFTVLMNHEFGNTAGAVRAHGSRGAFVSKWTINKNTLAVINGADLIQSVRLWNTGTSSYTTGTTAFNRFCSADLPAVSAFYNAATGLGTQNRIFMNGEESGSEGRAFGHIVTGTEAGVSYELPYLGKFSWENSVASPVASNKTIVAGMDDATTGGQVYIYIGTKTNTGNDIEKAGLSGGKLYGVKVTGMPTESSASTPAIGTRFTLFDHGQVQNTTGTALDAASIAAGVTGFLRPEDGAWDPSNPRDFYFATTNSFSSPSRLWRLRFDDIANPELGGTVEAVLNGTEGQRMLDNITIDNYGHVLMVEDVGGNAHNGKVWQYTIATDELKQIGKHDVARFGDLTTPATAPYNQDEEASGILDVQSILGAGWFLVDDQAHYNSDIPSDIVEGGQFLAMYNPDTYNASVASLPLNLLEFAGRLVAEQTQLTWKTSAEQNTHYFEVERSIDGVHFTRLTTVSAVGRGSNSYATLDASPVAGNNYYRLKMVDKDGKFSYSPVLLIKLGKAGKAEFTMYPNPAKDQLVIAASGVTGNVTVTIYNQQGQRVMNRQIAASTTTLSVAHLPAGMYMVQFMADGVSVVNKLIKE